MLGQGRVHGGGAAHRNRRMEVMDRLGSHGDLSAQQRNDWQWFKEEWDKAMAQEHNAEWGGKFAETIQAVLEEIQGGCKAALSQFMYRETKRYLQHIPMLRL